MKILMSILFGLFLIVSPVEAAHHYVWNNNDYVCWMDDTTIRTSSNTCIFNIIMENRRTGEFSITDCMYTIFKVDNKYWFAMLDGECQQKEISYYDGWWEPYGLEWLQNNGYLE